MKGEESLQCKMRDRKGMPDEKLSAAVALACQGESAQRKSDYDSRASLKQMHARPSGRQAYSCSPSRFGHLHAAPAANTAVTITQAVSV